jgi:uncharacterized protein YbjT (DUF2867 family)
MQVLVVGANGQLGARCCAGLLAAGHAVRALVRTDERGAPLKAQGAEVVLGDLTAEQGVAAHLAGIDCLVITANPVVPRKGDDPDAVEAGLLRLVEATGASDVRRVVLVSLSAARDPAGRPMATARRRLEERVLELVPDSVVPRFPPFMEVWLAVIGSSIPLRGEEFATLGRPSPFVGHFRRLTGSLVEDRGLMLVPGSPDHRNAFIAIDDVADFCVRSVDDPALTGRVVDVGGPEVLSWRDVAATYQRMLGRRVRIVSTPGTVYAAAAAALRPWAPVAANTMMLNRLIATAETDWPDAAGGGVLDPRLMTTFQDFLAAKLALPPELPTVR